ncbi:MAG: hypothetical protein HYR98_10300 [Nitrospirae bacterium]|nr:hypothetical protein [Nitrospirota bacterium]
MGESVNRAKVAGVLMVFLMISCAAFARAGETSALVGRPIAGWAFQGLVQFPAVEAEDLAGFAVGEPLDRARLSRAITRLMATGRFADVRVEGEEEAGGTRLVFRVTEHPILRKIAWDVPLSMRGEIERRVPFRTNGAFDSRIVPRAERRIVSFLRGEGFASPVVEVRPVDETSGSVDLQVRIVPGEPMRWAGVEVVDRSGTKVDLPGGTSPPFGSAGGTRRRFPLPRRPIDSIHRRGSPWRPGRGTTSGSRAGFSSRIRAGGKKSGGF